MSSPQNSLFTPKVKFLSIVSSRASRQDHETKTTMAPTRTLSKWRSLENVLIVLVILKFIGGLITLHTFRVIFLSIGGRVA